MTDEAGPSRKALRAGQREVKSCGFCYRRKLKCDKVYPCSRCVARGLAELCEQETVVVNGRVTGGGERAVRRQPTLAQLKDENKSLHRKIATQEKLIHGLLDQQAQWEGKSGAGANDARRQSVMSEEGKEGISEMEGSRETTPGEAETEARGAGLEDRTEYLTTVGQVFGLSGKDMASGQQPTHLFAAPSPQTLISLKSFVPLHHSSALVAFHCTYLHWIHTVFHIPTFLRDHDAWIAAIRTGTTGAESYDFFALYFAVIASSLYFMDEAVATSLGFSQVEISFLPRFWFDTSLNCLQLSGFMTYPTMPNLQAICILPTIAHAFDSSKYLSSLMHCALGLARDLNFHLVQDESPSSAWGGNIQAQLVRRIWWCLMIADSLTPGAQHPFHLSYPSAWTSMPANIDDIDLSDDHAVVPKPLNQVTCVSHVVIMGRLADIFRDFCHSFAAKQSLPSRFRLLKACDTRLLSLFADCPDLCPDFLASSPHSPSVMTTGGGGFDWRPWSRHIWAYAIPSCRIQLWRWFLGRSYTDTRFAEARTVCVEAARRTIAVHARPVPPMWRKNWHVSSFTVMCGMVLAIELMHGRPSADERRQLHGEVTEILEMLRKTVHPNAMVQRGVVILEKMLADAEASAPPPPPPAWTDIGDLNGTGGMDSMGGLGWGIDPIWPTGHGDGQPEPDLFDMLFNTNNVWNGTFVEGLPPQPGSH